MQPRVIGSVDGARLGSTGDQGGVRQRAAAVEHRLVAASRGRGVAISKVVGVGLKLRSLAATQRSRICSANFLFLGVPMDRKTVYQTDSDGLFMYQTIANELALAPGSYNIPFGAYEDAPPEAQEGKVQRREGAAWVMVDDYRTTPLWVVETGAQYAVGSEHDGADGKVSYPGWGALPEWLTAEEPQGAADGAPED